MAAPSRSVLSAAAGRALPFVTAGVARGLSANALQSELAAAGIGVRRTDLLAAVAFVRDVEQAGERLRFVRKDRRPDPARIPEAKYPHLLRADAAYIVRVTGTDPLTGEELVRHVTVSTSQSFTVGELEDIGGTLAIANEEYAPFEVGAVNIVGAVRR